MTRFFTRVPSFNRFVLLLTLHWELMKWSISFTFDVKSLSKPPRSLVRSASIFVSCGDQLQTSPTHLNLAYSQQKSCLNQSRIREHGKSSFQHIYTEENFGTYDKYVDPFHLLSTLAATTLLRSDRRCDAIREDTGARTNSATNWIDEASAFRFRQALDKLKLRLPGENRNGSQLSSRGHAFMRESQDEAIAWLRWMRSTPHSLMVELSTEARLAANDTVSDDFLRLLSAGGDESTRLTVNGMSNKIEDAAFSLTAPSNTSNPPKLNIARIRNDFLSRLGCRLILLPSGQSLKGGLIEPIGAYVFGKLLYGGVTRYRVLPNASSGGNSRDITNSGSPPARPQHRAGERTERKGTASTHIPSWVQYGGTERRYDAVDMGPAMILEWTLLPKLPTGVVTDSSNAMVYCEASRNVGIDVLSEARATKSNDGMDNRDMVLHRLAWNPHKMLDFLHQSEKGNINPKGNRYAKSAPSPNLPVSLLHGKERNHAFALDFQSRLGGLGPQIDTILRRVLDGRIIQPTEMDVSGSFISFKEAKEFIQSGEFNLMDKSPEFGFDKSSKQLSLAAMEAEELALLGLTPVRGLLLYGPPGCGKTALAREIARALKARAPKIVAAPELLDRWVGGSERLVRELFHDAEAELAACNGDPTRSALHVIVIDEIDAVFRKRSSAEDSGEATRSSTVNQILAKLDGVESIPNVLLIGMTNRRELLDEALLRPGRLEVQIEIPLPHKEGRREILRIHFGALRNRGRLSYPLCCAIDGIAPVHVVAVEQQDLSEKKILDGVVQKTDGGSCSGKKRKVFNSLLDYLIPSRKIVYDLADDSVTGGFSGADLEGLVRCAGSIALSRARKDGGGVEAMLITIDDVRRALDEVKI